MAAAGKLHKPAVLERQVRRMLADPRSQALVTNFAASGCTCAISTRSRRTCGCFPISTTTCARPSARRPSCFFESILREDRSVLDLLRANYTFVNERLAKHYGIPHVYGSRFRRVDAGRGQRARRTAAPRQHPDGHVVRHAHLAGDSRQVDPRQPPRRAAAAAAAGRAGAEGQHGRRQPARCASGWPSTAPIRPAPAATT